MKQTHFNDLKHNLTDHDIELILSIVGHRCRVPTINRLRSILRYSPSLIPAYGIFTRLVKETSAQGLAQWSYIAGQSYTDEIRTLRNCILNG